MLARGNLEKAKQASGSFPSGLLYSKRASQLPIATIILYKNKQHFKGTSSNKHLFLFMSTWVGWCIADLGWTQLISIWLASASAASWKISQWLLVLRWPQQRQLCSPPHFSHFPLAGQWTCSHCGGRNPRQQAAELEFFSLCHILMARARQRLA